MTNGTLTFRVVFPQTMTLEAVEIVEEHLRELCTLEVTAVGVEMWAFIDLRRAR